MPDFSHETGMAARFGGPVCGIDEAGRGPWAGPVVAAAVILDPENFPDGLDDSKKLTADRRARLFDDIATCAKVGIGQAEVGEIDRLNILQATFLAMQRAFAALRPSAACAIIDGNKVPPQLDCSAMALIKGDSRSLSVAAASVIAKVTRDRIMTDLATRYPGYGWERNAGYGTIAHRQALERLGVTPEHRKSFAPIRKMLTTDTGEILYVDSKSLR